MPSANIETDPFFVLLTDALRAGPGSPQWHDAVAHLRRQGVDGADEHRLLIDARENLENGKEYRSLRAGPGFTRKLMTEIESDAGSSKSSRPTVPTATIVAFVCGLLILSTLAYVGYRLAPHPPTGQAAIDDLENKSHRLIDTVATATFTGNISPNWHRIGQLPLDESDGLRPAPVSDSEPKNLGGGVVWNNGLPGNQPFAVDITIHTGQPSGNVLLEAFVSTDPSFSPDKGTSSRDLVWQLRSNGQQVLLSGSGQTLTATQGFGDGDTARLIVDQSVAIIETLSATTGKTHRLWAGAHDLTANARYIGVRFLQTGAPNKTEPSVTQIKVTTSPG